MNEIIGTLRLTGRCATHMASCPRAPWTWRVANLVRYRLWDWPRLAVAHVAARLGTPVLIGRLFLRLHKADGSWIDYGLVSTRLVTTAFVTLMVDNLQAETSAWGDFKFHGIGTGTTAAAVGDTLLETELTTEYATDNTRPTGSQTETSATVYRSVGTITIDSGTPAITEHGLFNAAASGAVTLMDRHVFSAVNMVGGDSLVATYELTCAAGG